MQVSIDDQRIISNIAQRAEDRVLDLLSRTPLWSSIVPLLSDQSWWFRRLDSRFNLPAYMQWTGNEKGNWHQVYNILMGVTIINPFLSADGLSLLNHNEWNALALRYLLTRFDPSVNNSESLVAAAQYGSVASLRVLLADLRVDPNSRERNAGSHAAYYAAGRGSIERLQVLLSDPRISLGTIRSLALTGAATTDQVTTARYLLDLAPYTSGQLSVMLGSASEYDSISIFRMMDTDPVFEMMDNEREAAVSRAIKHGSIRVFQYMLTRGERWLLRAEYTKYGSMAIEHDKLAILKLLNSERELRANAHSILSIAARADAVTIIDYILDDRRMTSDDLATAIQSSLNENKSRSLAKLISDPRASVLGYMLLILVTSLGNVVSVREVLLRCIYTRLTALTQSNTATILRLHSYQLEDSIQGAVSLSGLQKEVVVAMLGRDFDGYSFSHFEMLLREIVFKRLDLSYYFDWIIEQVRQPNVQRYVKRLISEAADSVITDRPIVHTSADFTAYSGFILLANTRENAGQVMDQLRGESGVTNEGLRRAGLLIGAYLGKTKLDAQR